MNKNDKNHNGNHKNHNPTPYSSKEIKENKKKQVDVWKYKPYIGKAKILDIRTDSKIIIVNEAEAKEYDVYSGYRTELHYKNKFLVATVDVSNELIKEGEIGLTKEIHELMKIKNGEKIELIHMNRPASIEYVKNKLDGKELDAEQVKVIVDDIMSNKLSEVETAAWVTAAYIRGFTDNEIIALTNSTVESGERLDLGKKVKMVLDKHCIGGVVGNRTTMLLVPIIAALKLYIPKTSSRAITSPTGTADTMEVLAPVGFGIDELKEIVLKNYGAIVWGGGMKLAPIDDKLIRIRNPMRLDPEGMLLASILGKKKCVGATHIMIDIPVGRGAKILDVPRAQELAKHFIKIGANIGMKIETLITDGAEPVGNGIGAALECRDVLQVLEGGGPDDLKHKACLMSGKLLELCGKANKGQGYAIAEKTLLSGAALKKMKEIIEAQGGDPRVKSEDMPIGKYTYEVTAKENGKIFHIDNKTISKITRIAGSPRDKGAGVYLYRIRGDRVEKGDKLFTLYAESEAKLSFAIKALEDLEPVEMRRMLLEVMD
ncbi:MAG: AMP phosphorylase [Candidatus Micrarchaeota archaeon]